MTTVRILHISDLHICKHPNYRQMSKRALGSIPGALRNITFAQAYCPDKLFSFIQFVRGMKDSLDAIIITGDIATTGRRFDLEEALIVVEEIKAVGVPVYLLPGNHDRWIPHDSVLRNWRYDPGGKEFHGVFREFWEKDVKTFPIPKDDFTVAIVAADLSLKQADDCDCFDRIAKLKNKHGQGRVYPRVLQDMADATLAVQRSDVQNNVVVLWAVHFPPSYPNIESHLRLLDEGLLVKKACELAVPAVLAGHTHDAMPYPLADKSLHVFCAGTLTEYRHAKNQFYIISIEDSDSGCHVNLENFELDGDEYVSRPLAVTSL